MKTDELQLCKFKEIALQALTNSCMYYNNEYRTCNTVGESKQLEKCDKKCGRVDRFTDELEKLIKQEL